MTLSSAKAKLDAQGGDPVSGYISKQDHKDSYDELMDTPTFSGTVTSAGPVRVDSTTDASSTTTGSLQTDGGLGVAKAVHVGTDLTVGGNLNGRDPDDLTAGPASATDNAVARFNGTGGKTIQNSGVTIDDSNNVTGVAALTMSGDLFVSDPSGDAAVFLNRVSTQAARVYYQTGGVVRWSIVSTNADAQWRVQRFDDAGTFLDSPLDVSRSNGRVQLGVPGATGGLEYGTSGPRDMVGTGSPEGVVSAPVGSTWRDTNATNGAIQWIKATGTGNTGWKVEYGDTGWRNVSASLDATFLTANPNATLNMRRVGDTVEARFNAGASGTHTTNYAAIYAVPLGFRTGSPVEVVMNLRLGSPGASTNCLYMSSTTWRNGQGWASGNTWFGNVVYTTGDAWPTSLPGV